MDINQPVKPFFDFDVKFPPLSRTVAEVSSLLGAGGMPDTDRLINIVHMDPLVVASVLKRINSAFYGMRQQFQDIRKAILMIGFIEVCNIVLASGYVGLKREITSDKLGKLIDRIMRVSIGTGYFSNVISQHLRLPEKSSAFTAGLLLNIGRFVLIYNQSDLYEKLYTENSDSYIPSTEAETAVWGYDNSTLGATAAKHWNFPDLIVSLIESYQKPGQLLNADHRTIALVLSATSSIALQLCTNYEELLKSKGTQATVSAQEDEEDPIDNLFFPININFPGHLNQVALQKDLAPSELQILINDHQREALQYINMMMNA